jgi:protein O-GlcNAc transferase
LPRSLVCFRTFDSFSAGNLPTLNAGHVTFGCFNRFNKLNRDVLSTWAQILARVPNSRLLLHESFGGMLEPPLERCLPVLRQLIGHGISADRIQFAGSRSMEDNLKLHERVDIMLDPFPYNGMTTTCDALWMGVPVVTLAGAAHIGRIGASFLHTVDLTDWVAHDATAYVELAVNRANDLDTLRILRSELRERMQSSALRDEAGYTRELEQAYLEMMGTQDPS